MPFLSIYIAITLLFCIIFFCIAYKQNIEIKQYLIIIDIHFMAIIFKMPLTHLITW